jgi:hypothetical protein
MDLFRKREPETVVCVCKAHVPFEALKNRQIVFREPSKSGRLDTEMRADCPSCGTTIVAGQEVVFNGAAGYFAKAMIVGFCDALSAQAEFVRSHVEPVQHPAKP